MNIFICDDNKAETNELAALLTDEGHTPAAFYTGAEALGYIEEGGPAGACILDIVMPGMSGIELAARLRKKGWNGRIVFLSTSAEYGPQSYEVKAFDYLLKPVTPQSVRAMLQKLIDAETTADTKSLMLKTAGTVQAVLYRDISYVEVTRHTVTYYLTDGTNIAVYASFYETAEQLLADTRFARCHRSYIVNLNEIKTITGYDIVMRSGARIQISKSYTNIKQRYFEHGLNAPPARYHTP